MSLFIRKIEKGKWLKPGFLEKGEIPADAITLDLRTDSNALSVWEIESEDEVADVVLAFVAGGNTVETIDVMILDADYLRKNDIGCVQSDGNTPYENRKKSHRELVSLNYRTLGIIASHIADGFAKEKTKRFIEGRLKEMLQEATSETGKFPFECLDARIQNKIRPR